MSVAGGALLRDVLLPQRAVALGRVELDLGEAIGGGVGEAVKLCTELRVSGGHGQTFTRP